MAKKRNSGLGRGLDSLIPKIDDIKTEPEEGISLEDLLKETDEEKEETKEVIIEDDESEDEIEAEHEEENEEEEENTPEEVVDEENTSEEAVEKKDEKPKLNQEGKISKNEDSSEYTNIFFNDDEKIDTEKGVENIKSSVDYYELNKESIGNIEAKDNLMEGESLLTEKEEKLVDEVIETVESNPRITLWSARSAAVLRFLRKTEPEFSISSEASRLIDEAIAEEYPEIWAMFSHL